MGEFKPLGSLLQKTQSGPSGKPTLAANEVWREETFEVQCEYCGDTGKVARRAKDIPVGQPGYLVFDDCSHCVTRRVTGIPQGREYQRFTSWDPSQNPAMTPAVNRCREVASGKVWCAFLCGPYGLGKTFLAIAALHEYGDGCFWKAPDLLDHIRRLAFDQDMGVDQALKPFRYGKGLLVLDDLGVEKRTEWAAEQLYRVLDTRSEEKLPTVITTNADLGAIDGRLTSRYAEGMVICRGKDIRRKWAQEREGC